MRGAHKSQTIRTKRRVSCMAFLHWSKPPCLTVFHILFRRGSGGCHGNLRQAVVSWRPWYQLNAICQDIDSKSWSECKYAFFWCRSPACLCLSSSIFHFLLPPPWFAGCLLPFLSLFPSKPQALLSSIRLKIWPSEYPERISDTQQSSVRGINTDIRHEGDKTALSVSHLIAANPHF